MKKWDSPAFIELNVKSTAYSKQGGTKQDGWYDSYDGRYHDPTYGPSGDNNGTPEIEVEDTQA